MKELPSITDVDSATTMSVTNEPNPEEERWLGMFFEAIAEIEKEVPYVITYHWELNDGTLKIRRTWPSALGNIKELSLSLNLNALRQSCLTPQEVARETIITEVRKAEEKEMSRELPIIFDNESVDAILAGRKTQMRKVVKPFEPRGCRVVDQIFKEKTGGKMKETKRRFLSKEEMENEENK